jgi:uncharacterized protein YktB (UPF0637 family)
VVRMSEVIRLNEDEYSESRKIAMDEIKKDKEQKVQMEDKMVKARSDKIEKVKKEKVVKEKKPKKGDKIVKMYNDKKTLTQTLESLKGEMSEVYIRKTWKKLEKG